MSPSSGQGLSKSQFHHYVPQFILRKFSNYDKLYADYIEKGFDSTKAQKSAKRNARIGCLSLELGYEAAGLVTHKVDRTFGVQDMYCGISSEKCDRQEIEKMLAGLEQEASKILKAIEDDFKRGRPTMTIRRPQKDTLRKFLFIMLYRNRKLHSRYEKTAENYDYADRELLLKYMRAKGLRNPKDVWLANIKAFIELRLGPDSNRWVAKLKAKTDPEGALWFERHLQGTFLAFCTPIDGKDEFILTQNAFGIYEGPSGPTGWIDWHVFSPISPKLIIVMRQNMLQPLPCLEELGLDLWPNVDRLLPGVSKSWLEHLSIERPTTSYKPITYLRDESRPVILSENDSFTYKFFTISKLNTQIINSIFLEEGIDTQCIAYKTSGGLLRALDSYLKEVRPGLKVAHDMRSCNEGHIMIGFDRDRGWVPNPGEGPEYRRIPYVLALERVARSLGSMVKAKYDTRDRQTLEVLPPLPERFFEKWCKLGGTPGGYEQLLVDFLQADRITTLITRTDAAVKGQPDIVRATMQYHRRKLLNGLNPRRVWMHLRQLRAMLRVGPEEYHKARGGLSLYGSLWKRLITQDESNGPEEKLIPAYHVFRPQDFCRAMNTIFIIDQYIRRQAALSFEVSKQTRLLFDLPGTILHCGIPKLEHRAKDLLEQAFAQMAAEQMRFLSRPSLTIEYRSQLELIVRSKLSDEFNSILKQELSLEIRQGLKEVLFGRLYRTSLPTGRENGVP